MLHGPQSGGGSCRDADLVVDVLDVVVGRFRRDVEPIRDLARRESPRRESQHIDLATGEPARIPLTGKQLFSSELDSFNHFTNPVVAGGTVYAVTWDGKLYAFGLKK